MRILAIANADLYRPRGGSPLYCYNRWRRIAKRHKVTFLLTDTQPRTPDPGMDSPDDWCERVYCVPDQPRSFGLRLERKLRRVMPWKSRESGWWMNREVRQLARRLLTEERFDLLHIEGFPTWWAVPFDPGIPISYTAMDVVSRFADNTPQPGDPFLQRFFAARRHEQLVALEPREWRRASLITTITSIEKQYIAERSPGVPIEVIPNGVDMSYFCPTPAMTEHRPPVLVFTGIMNYRPNVDAMQWFVSDILPLIRAQVPDVRLVIVGKDPSPEVSRMAEEPGIEVTGSVPDVRPYLREAAVVVAPVRLGAGMRGKHLEAMAMRLPVVATNFCVEGTACTHNVDILLADDAKSFAADTVRLLTDHAEADRIGLTGMELIQREYNWDINAEKMADLLERCVNADR